MRESPMGGKEAGPLIWMHSPLDDYENMIFMENGSALPIMGRHPMEGKMRNTQRYACKRR
jgi:hypothetical protein